MAEVQIAALDSPEKERGSLAAWLLESLPPHSGNNASDESVNEAVRRRDELDSGRVPVLSSDKFWAAVEEDRKATQFALSRARLVLRPTRSLVINFH